MTAGPKPASRPADAPPISLGAFSLPMEEPIPMTTSEITEVPSDRRNDSRSPSPHTTSSISVRSPGVRRRSSYQAAPPGRIRRTGRPGGSEANQLSRSVRDPQAVSLRAGS